jgi:3-hydroxymyristoyl/3-hydroxydecanoyl-(acyl carrier protein) dehydratase
MRFIFVDRILTLDPDRTIEILKNVTATEDVFDDHFPGYPILPGALVIETFEQASQLLIGMSHDFARVGRLQRVERAAFRHFVRPGDQLRVRCARVAGDEEGWTVRAAAEAGGRRAASATLHFALVEDKAHGERLREAVRVLRAATIEAAGQGGPA